MLSSIYSTTVYYTTLYRRIFLFSFVTAPFAAAFDLIASNLPSDFQKDMHIHYSSFIFNVLLFTYLVYSISLTFTQIFMTTSCLSAATFQALTSIKYSLPNPTSM